jgi:hypothetical protein
MKLAFQNMTLLHNRTVCPAAGGDLRRQLFIHYKFSDSNPE